MLPVFVAPPPQNPLTGGYRFNHCMVQAMNAGGIPAVEVFAATPTAALPRLRALAAAQSRSAVGPAAAHLLVILDSLYLWPSPAEGLSPLAGWSTGVEQLRATLTEIGSRVELGLVAHSLPGWGPATGAGAWRLPALLGFDWVICPSRAAAAAVDAGLDAEPQAGGRLSGSRPRVVVVQPGIEVHPTAHREPPDGVVRLLTVANWTGHKGQLFVLNVLQTPALAALPWRWTIVGALPQNADDAGAHEYRAFQAALRHGTTADRVAVCGRETHAAVLRRMAQCDALVLASDWESFGMVYQEAAASGVPSIGNRVGGTAEAIFDGRTGVLCAAGEHDCWQRTLRRLIIDTAWRERLAAACRAQSYPSWSRQARLLVETVTAGA